MAYNVQNIVAGINSRVLYKDYNSSNALPTLAAYGADLSGSDWDDFGATSGGTEVSIETETNDIPIDQSLDPALTLFASRNTRLTSTGLEFTPTNIQLATGQGTVSALAAGSGTRGHSTYTLGDTLTFDYNSWLVEAQNPTTNEAIQWFVPRGFAVGGVTARVGQADQAAQVPFEIRALAGHSAGTLVIRAATAALP